MVQLCAVKVYAIYRLPHSTLPSVMLSRSSSRILNPTVIAKRFNWRSSDPILTLSPVILYDLDKNLSSLNSRVFVLSVTVMTIAHSCAIHPLGRSRKIYPGSNSYFAGSPVSVMIQDFTSVIQIGRAHV